MAEFIEAVEFWQVVLALFVILLPLGLMVDFWGDERVTFRGRPIQRDWIRQVHPADPDADDHH